MLNDYRLANKCCFNSVFSIRIEFNLIVTKPNPTALERLDAMYYIHPNVVLSVCFE